MFHLSLILETSKLSPFPSGVPKISLMIKRMLGETPNIYFRACWLLFCPMLVLVRCQLFEYNLHSLLTII